MQPFVLHTSDFIQMVYVSLFELMQGAIGGTWGASPGHTLAMVDKHRKLGLSLVASWPAICLKSAYIYMFQKL